MSAKMAKRIRRLEGRMNLAEATLESHDKRLDNATKWAAAMQKAIAELSEKETNRSFRRRARKAERAVVAWRRMTYAVLVAAIIVLVAAILVVYARADDAESIDPPVGVTATETASEPVEEPEEPENELIVCALLDRANVIESCEVTWYTEDTCGKTPDDPAYGITRSGLPVVEHLTCAVDPEVIPMYSDVFVRYDDGTIEQLWATDTGVKGNAIDIYTPDYDYAIQCGRQRLTVWWVAPEEVA